MTISAYPLCARTAAVIPGHLCLSSDKDLTEETQQRHDTRLSEQFASVSGWQCLYKCCEQNVMIQIAPLGLHKTSWAHVRAVSGQAWITKGISSCSSLTPRLPLLRQLGFITHDGDSWVLTQTSHNRAVCHLIRGVTFLADFTDDECPCCNVPCAVPRDTRYASHSRSHKGCEQKLSSYLDHKVQSSHIFSLLSTFITLYVMFWSWDSFLEPVKCIRDKALEFLVCGDWDVIMMWPMGLSVQCHCQWVMMWTLTGTRAWDPPVAGPDMRDHAVLSLSRAANVMSNVWCQYHEDMRDVSRLCVTS